MSSHCHPTRYCAQCARLESILVDSNSWPSTSKYWLYSITLWCKCNSNNTNRLKIDTSVFYTPQTYSIFHIPLLPLFSSTLKRNIQIKSLSTWFYRYHYCIWQWYFWAYSMQYYTAHLPTRGTIIVKNPLAAMIRSPFKWSMKQLVSGTRWLG